MSDTPMLNTTVPGSATGRRRFLRDGALAAFAAGTLAACRKGDAEAAPAGKSTAAAPPPPLSAREKSDEMDRMHEAGIKAFPAKTEGKGNQLMEPRLENGVKVYELTAQFGELRLTINGKCPRASA